MRGGPLVEHFRFECFYMRAVFSRTVSPRPASRANTEASVSSTSGENSTVRCDQSSCQKSRSQETTMTIRKNDDDEVPPPPEALTSQRTSLSLKKQTSSLHHHMATTPITKHYELNNQILGAFESHFEAKLYQVAYAMGLQFCETALLEIPKHGYFYSKRHERERMQSSLDAVRVTGLLREIQQNEYDFFSEEEEKQRVQTLQTLAMEQVEKASEAQQYEAQRARAERASQKVAEWVLLEPFLSCQDSISTILCPQPSQRSPSEAPYRNEKDSAVSKRRDNNPKAAPAPAAPIFSSDRKRSQSSSRETSGLISGADDSKESDWIQVRRSTVEDLLLEKALYLSGLEIVQSKSNADSEIDIAIADGDAASKDFAFNLPKTTLAESKSRLEFQTLSALYHDDFDQLVRREGRIRIRFVNTYQGRLSSSINGCTVIAALICYHHLIDQLEGQSFPDNDGLEDSAVESVIDLETGVVLEEVRRQLGLADQSFLIPSDVHDYLMANGQLHSSQFVDVIGGNILDETHVSNLIRALEENPKKLAATLFFHEHVVAILKIRRSKTECWYAIIDSLPLKDTLMYSDETSKSFRVRMGRHIDSNRDEEDNPFMNRTAIFKCMDAEALRACLRWYACSKFSAENIEYIDAYEWSDNQSDFDPRVFQMFVWGTPTG